MPITAIDDRDTLFGNLEDHYLRLGDTQFFVPPTSISVHRQMKTSKVSMLRSRSSIPVESGYSDRIVTFTIFFPDLESINFELRPLLAQAKKCPFLPVQNTYLNDALKIEALTIQHVSVQSTPGFPHTLQAVIQAYTFDPASYIYGTTDKSFDEMFNWPLFRWYYSMNLDPKRSKKRMIHTYYEPLSTDLHDGYTFKVADEADLNAIREWKRKKRDMIKDWMEDKQNKVGIDFEDWLQSNEQKEAKFNTAFDKELKKAQQEYDLHYNTWDCGDLILKDFSISFENTIVSQPIQMLESPTHQYLGSQDVAIVARFETDDIGSVTSLENLVKKTTYLTREYHKEVANGFLEMDHQLTRLFGVTNVAIEDMVIDTVPGMPGVYSINLSLLGYNRIAKKMNEVKALSLKTDWEIDYGESMGWDRPGIEVIRKGIQELRGQFPLSKDAQQQAVYNAKVMQTFKAAELYPDLELPTYEEVKKAGFNIDNLNDGIFVDPDFFIAYDAEDFSDIINTMLTKDPKSTFRDASGGEAEFKDRKVTLNETAKKQKDEAQSQTSTKNQKLPDENYKSNKQNLSTADMETIIRKQASNYGVDQSYALAFVQGFDPKLRHFYEKGSNRDFNNTYTLNANQPILQDPDFKYSNFGTKYTGVMRVREKYAYKQRSRDSILYNVEAGMKGLKTNSDIITQKVMKTNTKPLFDLFGKKSSIVEEYNQVHFIATVFYYLGFEKELNELLSKNKKPPAELTKLMKKILKKMETNNDWTSKQTSDKYAKLPVADYRNTEKVKDAGTELSKEIDNLQEDDFKDHANAKKAMLHDILKYDRRGRLVRAFPTYFLTFIDEGQYIDSIKMSDQYFHYRAINDISYNNSRKQASSTLYLELSNVFGSLDDAEKNQDLTYTSLGDMLKAAWMPGAAAKEAERSRHRDPNYYKSIYLRTGVRVHFRMGYGSNVLNMPTIMNGTVTSMQNNTETMSIVVQDDGIELTNKLNGVVDIKPDDETSGFLHTKKEPTEIVDELLTDSQGLWKNISALLSNKEYENHSLGIMHFGEPGGPQGWTDFMNLMPDANLFDKDSNRKIAEINMNVYQTTGLLNGEQDTWWNTLMDNMGMGKADEVGININLFDKTVWDVLNITSAIAPDFVVAVHPFGLRNTIFHGRPYFPLHYDYKVDTDKDEVTGIYAKTFKQMRIYDSVTTIIDNSIKASEDNMYTVAVGTYLNEGKMEVTPPIYVDTDIWPEKQKTVNIDTTLNAKGVWLFDKTPLIGPALNKPFQWYFDEGVALRIAASGLRDFVKDMYDGYLTVMGDPGAKPYDTMVIQDMYNDMSGPADIKEVIHIMNHDVGFVTMLKPDVIAYNSDKNQVQFINEVNQWIVAANATIIMRALARRRGYDGGMPILNMLWSSTSKQYKKMKGAFDNSYFGTKSQEYYNKIRKKWASTRPGYDPNIIDMTTTTKPNGTVEADIKRWKASGIYDQVIDAIDGLDRSSLDKILSRADDYLYKKNTLNYQKIDSKKIDKVKDVASNILMKGGKASKGGLKYGKEAGLLLKGIWKGKHALLGPVGILTFLIETAVTELLVASVGEFIDRALMTRQAVIISPLKKDGVQLLAGVNGHKGSVVGDAPDFMQGVLGMWGVSGLLSWFGVDASQYQTPPEADSSVPGMQAAKSPSQEMVTWETAAENLFKGMRRNPVKNADIAERYKRDVQAAQDEIKGRIEWLQSQSEEKISADYSDIKNAQDKNEGWFSKFKDWLGGLGGDDEGDQVIGDDLSGGKAKTSAIVRSWEKTFKKYATQYGVPQYVELLLAMCMRESGGGKMTQKDVMQSSESLSLPRNTLSFDRSVKQGVYYFSYNLKKAGGDARIGLQAYNYGEGFVEYAKKKGGYSQEVANGFSNDRGGSYGDKKYVPNVLAYFTPSPSAGGATDFPSVTGSAGKSKYHLSSGEASRVLISAKSQKGKHFGTTIVGGTDQIRKGTFELLNQLAKLYKEKTGTTINMTSGFRSGDPNWHGTGYGVDVDTPNTMRRLSGGKLGFPPGKDKENAMILADLAAQVGFNGIIFGDYFILEQLKKKYPGIVTQYRPGDHHNHLHLSFPTGKKK